MTEEQILAAAKRAGFRDEAALRRLVRPAAVLRPGRAAKGKPVRGSKFGGLPWLPGPDAWPTHDGRPLSFLAQVDLSEVPRGVAADLPSAGMLSFFYAADEQPWGFDPRDAGKFAVRHFPATVAPSDPGAEPSFPEIPVKFEETLTLPSRESVLVENLHLDRKAAAAYDALEEALREREDDTGRSLLLGHPGQVQGDMAGECSLVTAGVYCGDETMAKHPRYGELCARGVDWRLLLQLHSVEEAGMCWGDLGCLYFWIRDEDLRRREFGAGWTVLQCT